MVVVLDHHISEPANKAAAKGGEIGHVRCHILGHAPCDCAWCTAPVLHISKPLMTLRRLLRAAYALPALLEGLLKTS